MNTKSKIDADLYTPKSIADIVFADDHSKGLIQDIVAGAHPFPLAGKNGILLYGIPGTGKSELAKLLPDAIEAIKTGGPANTRYERIKTGNNGAELMQAMDRQAMLLPLSSHHYFVLDEVDNLNATAMPALKSVMNVPQTLFVMTTNHVAKIDAAIRNRCHCIPFNAAPAEKWLLLAHRMLLDAGIAGVPDASLVKVIQTCNGSARDIVNAMVELILARRRMRPLHTPQAAVV